MTIMTILFLLLLIILWRVLVWATKKRLPLWLAILIAFVGTLILSRIFATLGY